jgi:hypothetical protein
MNHHKYKVEGWLSPDGKFVNTAGVGHSTKAEQILGKSGNSDDALLGLGWLKLHLTHGIMFNGLGPTSKQETFLLKYYGENGLHDYYQYLINS